MTDHTPSAQGRLELKANDVRYVFERSRNGTDGYTRHPIARRLIYTSGVTELCDAAQSYWLLDVIGTEATPKLLAQFETGAALGIIKLEVRNSSCVLTMTTEDDAPPIWSKGIPYTDFPAGDWMLFLACDTVIDPDRMCTVLYLPSEH